MIETNQPSLLKTLVKGSPFRVLNLYSCLGGNRLLWEDCEVTAVELDPELARMYQERFPNDKVIIADAHQYLLDHYKEFDFIWSSPPCPSHSKVRFTQKNKDVLFVLAKFFMNTLYSGRFFSFQLHWLFLL